MQFIQYFKNNQGQMIRYAIVGATGAVLDLTALYVLTEFANFYYLVSATLSFIFSALLNFYLNKFWTFKSQGDAKRQILIFALVAGSGVLLNNGILYVLVQWVHIYYMLAKVVSIALVTIWNFLWNKYFTFKA